MRTPYCRPLLYICLAVAAFSGLATCRCRRPETASPAEVPGLVRSLAQANGWYAVPCGAGSRSQFYLTAHPRPWGELVTLRRDPNRLDLWEGTLLVEAVPPGWGHNNAGERLTQSGLALYGDPAMVARAARFLDGR